MSQVNVPYNNPLLGETYESIEVARAALDNTCADAGFKMRISKTRPNSFQANYVVFECYKAPPRHTRSSNETKLRKKDKASSTCPYQVGLKLGPQGWTYRPVGGQSRDCHNHRFTKKGRFGKFRQAMLQKRMA